MASLTHVCMWTKNGWTRVTAEQAAAIHPGGTVSAHSGLFMCELCGQYVSLTDGDVRVRYFKHSAYEKSKDCPERTFGAGVPINYDSGAHDLPIRLRDIKAQSFKLELGFIKVPRELFDRKIKIQITPTSFSSSKYTYSVERVNPEGITYLSIGDNPSSEYKILLIGASEQLYQFWPRVIEGIDFEGTLFDKETGKKLPRDADITVGKTYYLLKKGAISVSRNHLHISTKEICVKSTSHGNWRLYEVKALDYDEISAKFFLDFHYRLTEKPVDIQPLWPVYVQAPYVIKHNKDSLILHVKGNANTHVFPYTRMQNKPLGTDHIVEINCNNRQQLISAGRSRALQYLYFWKEPLREPKEAKFKVTDIQEVSLKAGINNKLPQGKSIRIWLEYDGKVILKNKQEIIEIREIQAGETSIVDNIRFGTTVSIYISSDCVWHSSYEKEKQSAVSNEDKLLEAIISAGGALQPVAHSLGSVAIYLVEYPKIKTWLYSIIRKGCIPENSIKLLQLLVNQINTGAEIDLGGRI